MICHHCSEEIDSRGDHIAISRKRLPATALYFHLACFVAIAGDEYIKALANGNLHCRKCGGPLNGSRIYCFTCKSMIPPCPKCNSPMVPRTNKQTGNAFLGCSKYPACKSTRKIY